jgi:hypothetical protein
LWHPIRGSYNNTNSAGVSRKEMERESMGVFFKLAKLRQIGDIHFKGDPHHFRNGNMLYAIDKIFLNTDGYQVKISFDIPNYCMFYILINY